MRLPAESGFDLGYRGVLPRALTKALGGSGSPRAHLLVCRIAEAMGLIRATYLNAVKAFERMLGDGDVHNDLDRVRVELPPPIGLACPPAAVANMRDMVDADEALDGADSPATFSQI